MVKALEAIENAHVVILIIDAKDGIVEQDLHLLGHVLDADVRWLLPSINGMVWNESQKSPSVWNWSVD